MTDQSSTFEPLGYFETYSDKLTGRVLGNKFGVTPEPGRIIGFNGQVEKTITSNLTLTCGHRDKVFKASLNKPLVVKTIIFPISGKFTWKHPHAPQS